jgi:dTDP-4-dehydrorhamnose 3,5-epimerase
LFCANELKEIGHVKPIVNVNHSYTQKKGSIRGMHFQYPPDCEIKIVKCLRGAIWDCIVDLRKGSPTFLKWEGVELTENNHKMIYIPEGFAHGFQALTDDVELLYFHTNFYVQPSEGGLRYCDKAIGIKWPLAATVISDRDQLHPLIDSHFGGITVL